MKAQISGFLRCLVFGGVIVIAVAFGVQAVFPVFESAPPRDVDNLAARDLAWLFSAAMLLLSASPKRVWCAASSPTRELLLTWCRFGLAFAGLGLATDVIADFLVSRFVFHVTLGNAFALAGFSGLILALVLSPFAIVLAFTARE